MAWVLLLASAAAVAGTGIITTVLILSHLENWPGMSWWVLWPRAASLWPVYSAHYMAVLRKEAGHR
jgi:hypothetical protein